MQEIEVYLKKFKNVVLLLLFVKSYDKHEKGY